MAYKMYSGSVMIQSDVSKCYVVRMACLGPSTELRWGILLFFPLVVFWVATPCGPTFRRTGGQAVIPILM
jgi:hypothetical protein